MLQGKVAIITGASGAIGGAIAKTFAEAGATVYRGARRKIEGGTYVDVTEETSVAAMFDKVVESHGHVDILVNSAGVTAPVAAVEDLDISEFRKVLEVNVVGTMLCSKYAFKHKAKRIINIGSISSMAPRPLSEAYTASKFAVQGLTRSLALDGREKGVAVSVVHPGNVLSQLLTPEDVEQRQSEGFITSETVANAVLHIASLPDSSNILELTVLPSSQPLIGRG